jgi:sugar lactone lactonase YvrE
MTVEVRLLRMTVARKTLALLSALVFSTCALSAFVFAEGTRTWEQSKFEELIKGTPKGIALRSEGGLELAPAFKALATTPSTYIWAIASDSAGNAYAAAGSPARVYQITPDGQSTTIFEAQELQVQSLVVDKNGIVYAATAPDGKVYRLEPSKGTTAKTGAKSSWSATPYFDPGAKYIWDLVLDNAGDLYVATGDHGEIYKVSANGQHSLFFKSDEVHIRALALDPKGNLIAGSDGSGLIYRIAPNGEAFVLYSAPKKEITALAIDGAGNIYAAAAGEKRPEAMTTQMGITLAPAQNAPAPGGGNITITAAPAAPTASFPAPGVGATGGSEIYRIAPDGAPSRLWTSHEDLVYALAFDQHGRLLAGTGNRGHIFAINGVDDFTDLIKASASQITAFAPAPGGGLYASGSNLGKIFVLGPGLESEGTYESDVFDARIFSLWGRAGVRAGGKSNVELYARSGNVDNPDRNWSPWTRIDFALALGAGAETRIPASRFVQWKAVLHAGNPAPRVDDVLLNYLPKNVAPEIDEIVVQPGYRYQPIPRLTGGDASGQGQGQPRFEAPPPAVRDRDAIGIRWSAHDDNDDQLVYTVYYRGDAESRWLLLKDNLYDRYYSFDASLLPDGGYTVKVIASDAPSHSPGEALYAERASPRFEVDSTSPVIENLTAAWDGDLEDSKIDSKADKKADKKIDKKIDKQIEKKVGKQIGIQIHVRFRASDSFSPIKRAEYSLDGGDWQFVEPVGQLSDSKTEDYDFRVAVPQPEAALPPMENNTANDHVVVVRAYDRFDNLATAKTVIRGK